MANTGDVKVGSILRHNGDLVKVTEWVHRTPGKGQASYQAKMRNVISGKVVEYKFRSGEDVELARIEYRELQFIYKEGANLVCMDPESYEQIPVPEALIGDNAAFIKEEMIVKIGFEDDNPIIAEPPTFVELEITYTEPGVKGDTATNTLKPATVETGAEIRVPLFINQGEKIKIDTRTGEYVERVK
ncbi:MAG: elongation factor P [Bacteroidia bacterium]|nr:elongation factor P [Bacteroidia bacterium]NNC85460.1 elongation factor P [Bacteroidia bacterium]NNM16771.1 elongation factor P [Bacteroidia bacterium]